MQSKYWNGKQLNLWTEEEVWGSIFSWATDNGVDLDIVIPFFGTSGSDICKMSKEDFNNIDSENGDSLYELFQSYQSYQLVVGGNDMEYQNLDESTGHVDDLTTFFLPIESFELEPEYSSAVENITDSTFCQNNYTHSAIGIISCDQDSLSIVQTGPVSTNQEQDARENVGETRIKRRYTSTY